MAALAGWLRERGCEDRGVRREPSILHLDMDAFFAAVEQCQKPSLRDRAVVVGGLGPRGVVATASYEARRYGVGSAMTMAEARRRCPHAAFLAPRFAAYQAVSDVVMGTLREYSPLVEPLSFDEAYVDLAGGTVAREASTPSVASVASVESVGAELRQVVRERTGLAASVGAGTSKLVAKIASEMAKPDGLVVVPPGDELALLRPLPVTRLWGVGPATARRLARAGVATVADLAEFDEAELVHMLGQAYGRSLYGLARGIDERPVAAERELKSVSVEDTFDHDIADPGQLLARLDVLAGRVAARLGASGHAARTVTVKIRRYDFSTLARSETLPAPTDNAATIRQLARRLLASVEVGGGVRLLGVGVSGLADYAQGELFATDLGAGDAEGLAAEAPEGGPDRDAWVPGADVEHRVHGRGWVQGSGGGRVTVRFETPESPPGPARTFRAGDPDLRPADPPQAPITP